MEDDDGFNTDEDNRSSFVLRELESDNEPASMPAPPLGGEYEQQELIETVNNFTKRHGYAVVIKRSAYSRSGVKNKLYLGCTRGSKPRESKSEGKRASSSRRIDCPFLAVAKPTESGKWELTEIKNAEHTHEGAVEGTHAVVRRAFMTPEVRDEIRRQAKADNKPKAILTYIRDKYNDDPNNPIIEARDIYNALELVRASELGNRTPIQALNQDLENDPDWWHRVEKDPITTEVLYLFFIPKSSMEMLACHSEVMILDCTYKTNRYKMPLAIGSGVTCLNTSFWSGMCFLKGEKLEDYQWLIATYKALYQHMDVPLPEIWISDGEPNIPSAIVTEISPDAKHILCLWHIEKNVADNCKKHFTAAVGGNEVWEEFMGNKKNDVFGDFRKLLYTKGEDEFDLAWQNLQDKYNNINENICIYLANEIIPKRHKWNKTWTDQFMHFNNHTSSRAEGGNANIKKELGSSTGDLRTVVFKSKTACDRQRGNYVLALGKAKERLPGELRKPLYRDLHAFVTPFALRQINEHYKRLLKAQQDNTTLPSCTGQFKRTMGLPCAHVIEERLSDPTNGGVLKLSDVNSHWRFKKPVKHYREPDEFVDPNEPDQGDEDSHTVQNPLLMIQNPKVVKPKGRPMGSRNKSSSKRTQSASQSTTTTGRDYEMERQRAFDNSTRREPSRFEYTETVDLTSSVQVPSSQPPPSMRPPPTQFIRPPTFYPEPSMHESPANPYFQQPSPFDAPPSAQPPPSQVYSQWPNQVYSQPISTQNNSTTAGTKRSENGRGRGGGTKRARR